MTGAGIRNGRTQGKVLILGGTGEAADLARALEDGDIVSSLAGRTGTAPDLPGEVRIGGFGGAQGLETYLRREGIVAVIDATHPFAAQMAGNAAAACAAAGIPRLKLLRPEWDRAPMERWIEIDSPAEAAARLPALGKRVFLTVGVQEIAPFAPRTGCFFLIRLITAPTGPLPADHVLIQARPPFTPEDEVRLMVEHKIDLLVTKHSGGPATYGKILAARHLGMPVLMIRRPDPPAGPVVPDVEAALAWLRSVHRGA